MSTVSYLLLLHDCISLSFLVILYAYFLRALKNALDLDQLLVCFVLSHFFARKLLLFSF